MCHVLEEELPFVGSSHQFVAAEHGDVNVLVFLLSTVPGERANLRGQKRRYS